MAEITFQEEAGGSKIHQILVKFLDGNHKFLNFENPIIAVEDLKRRIQTLTLIPSHHQLLLLHDDEGLSRPTLLTDDRRQTLSLVGKKFPAVVHLLLRLRGGKGGFGSLLRGAASKAGQKKTNNFDACRDMSGRRMRHVNAERRLEEWVAEAEERKLEKVAEDYIKKINKEMVKKGNGKGGGDVEKYVQKYREDSEKCREEVDRAVRESLKGLVASKRKFSAKDKGVESKRLRIWFGKRKLGDGDSEGMDEDDSDKNEDGENKSVVLDNDGHSNLSKDGEGTPGSVIDTQHDMVSSDSGPSGSCSGEEKTGFEESPESDESRIVNEEASSLDESKLGISEEQTFQHGDNLLLPATDAGTASVVDEKKVSNESNLSKVDKSVCQITVLSSSGLEEATAVGASTIQYGDVTIVEEPVNLEKPLNFEEVNSAAELEVLGMETLKTELQSRGLKCGGTLQERAARLFLLKTTPLEMIPKKLFAKK